MDRDELDNIIKYNEHAIFLAEIALDILSNRKQILDVKGVKEIIAMYLLIPYITKQQLDKPSSNHNIPQLDSDAEFQKAVDSRGSLCSITLDALRNSLCHSFVTIEDRDMGYIIVDDRCILDRKSHDALSNKSLCEKLDINAVNTKLKELHIEIIKQQKKFNKSLYEKLFSTPEKS